MKIKRIKTGRSHLLLFVKDATLLVWSKVECELYGFEELGAAVFLYMESCQDEDSFQSVQNYFSPLSKTREFQTLITQIQQIVTPASFEKSTKTVQEALPLQTPKKEISLPFCCDFQLNEEQISIMLAERELCHRISSEFQHLTKGPETKPTKTVSIAIEKEKKGYSIYLDGIQQKSVEKKANLLPYLHDLIRIDYYQKHPFLIALHAAVLYKEEKAFIFPGVSGSGKSTIALYLMKHGFTLLSDELCVIDETFAITPLPLGITLKEGSWHVASTFVEDFNSLAIHKRFDNQNIKYIQPSSIQREKFLPKKFFFIFPKYNKDASNTLQTISIIDALSIFTRSQYHLFDDKDEKIVTKWIKLLGESKLYRLSFNDLKKVEKLIKEIY